MDARKIGKKENRVNEEMRKKKEVMKLKRKVD